MVQLDLSILRLMRIPTLAVALAAVLLTGCALAPAPSHDEVVTRALPADTRIPPTWKAAPETGPVVGDWLKSLDDPQLSAIVAEAIANNLDLRQAAEKVLAAQQTVTVVGAQLLPQVGIGLGERVLHDQDHSGHTDSTRALASVAWELDVWGKLRAQRASAVAAYEATALDYEWARQSLAATVAKTWYLATETRQLLALSEQAVTVYSELLRLVKARRAAGKDTDLNVVDMQANVDSALGSVEAARQSYGDARRSLEALLGRYPAAEIEAAMNYTPDPPPIASGIPAALLQRRPDVIATERLVLAAFRKTEAAKLALLPDFSIALTGGRLADPLLTLLRLNPWLATAAIGAAIPVYEGGALEAQVRIATAQQAQAVARYGSVVLTAFREVESALANEPLLARRAVLDESSLSNRTSAVRIATTQYLAGRKDLLWVSNLQTNQIRAEGDLIKLRALRHINRITLLLALGGSFAAAPTVRGTD
ncbi:MAG: efflux transporter outer membrane subunit [Candidatus Accumulibacter necessarius]|uniref:efflux transporter outer membrane subunit n=1 Tax=Candidatus Accumulibacter necessarius TaxID=2954386 RepID=UPI002FC2CBE7